MKSNIRDGSGNVFADLNIENRKKLSQKLNWLRESTK